MAYDSVNILFANLDGTETKAQAVAKIKSLQNYEGAMGDSLFVDETNTIRSLAVLKTIKEGKFELLN